MSNKTKSDIISRRPAVIALLFVTVYGTYRNEQLKVNWPSIMADGMVIGDPNEEKTIPVDAGKVADPLPDVLAAPSKPVIPVPELIVPDTIPDDVKPAIVLKQTQDDPEKDRVAVKGKPGRKSGRKPKK